MTRLRIDCHVHTCYSHDSEFSLASLVEICKAKGIDGICITDHNTIADAVVKQHLADYGQAQPPSSELPSFHYLNG